MTTRNRSRTVLTLAAVAMTVILTAASADAAITFDGFTSWLGSGNPYTGTFDASGSDKLVVVATGEHNFPNNLSGDIVNITYDGVGLTKAVEVNPADPATGGHGQTATDIWYLDNPGAVHTSGTIVFSVVGNGNNYVYTAMGLSGTAPGVSATAPAPGASSVNLTTTVADSMVIFNIGMGGQGNTASPLPGVTATSPAGAVTIDGLENGSNWAGHAVAYAAINSPGLYTFSFDTTKTDVATIAAAFEETYADPNLPTVLTGSNWVTWSGEPVTLDPNVVNNDEYPQRNLSYAWTASPAAGVVFTPNDGGDGSTSSALAPSVTITKAAPTGNATVVTLSLAVTLEGEDPVVDTMIIYVYDDACAAAKGIGCAVIGAGDFNGSCFTDIEDFAVLAAAWLVDYDVADLLMFSGTWLDGDVLTAPIMVTVTVPDVTGLSESEAQSIVTGLGLTTSSTYQYDEVVPLNDVISQNPVAGSEVAYCCNVRLVVSKGPPPVSELTIAEVYLAQTHVLRPEDSLFKLVGNRPTLLKVQVVAPDGTAVPTVTAVLTVDSETTTLTLDGPDTLPGAFEAALGKVEHRFDDSFTTLIPAEWIRPGLHIEVTAGSADVNHDIKVAAPTEVKMKMFDVHYFGLGNNDYPVGAFVELEAKWPVSDLSIERIRDINFHEMVIPARSTAPYVRITSKQDYFDQTGLNFDGEQAAALQWVGALSASGGNYDTAMQYINIIGVPAGGQAGGFNGVGGVSLGILNHELGHALSLPHWGNNSSYPYKGEMYGIEPQPGVYMGTHVGPTWAFDLPSLTFIPPTVQEDSVGGEVGYYKKSPMQGGGVGDQEQGFFFRHFSDFGVNRMQSYLEGKVAVLREGNYYKWNDATGDYTTPVTSNGVRYPIEQDVQVISVMAATTLSDMNVNMVYPPIGPYEGNLILTFDPTSASDRAAAAKVFAPSGGCDFSLRVVQGGQQKTYMLPASGIVGSPYSNSTLKTAAVNLRASDGDVTQVELLLTPDAEKDGLPANPEVLHTWTE